MSLIIWIIFFVTFPMLIMYLCQRYSILDKIGAVVLCYGAGILVGNLGIFPQNILKAQTTITEVTIALALPLLFFSINLKRWSRLAGKSLISFIAAIISVLASTTTALLLFKSKAPDTWKVSGMLIGCYTGGTPNLASIGTALQVDPAQYVAVHASDVFIGAIYLLIVITVLPKILGLFLPSFSISDEENDNDIEDSGFKTHFTGFTKQHIKPIAGALLLAMICVGIGVGLSEIVPKDISMVVAILSITTLGAGASFIDKVRNIEYTFQLGYYIILIFSLVVSSMADVSKLINTAPVMIAYVTIAVFVAAAVHALLSFITRVDRDTHIITSVALVLSPPFVPMVAASLKNKDIVVTGVFTGILGWVIGNYLGISYAYMLKNFFF